MEILAEIQGSLLLYVKEDYDKKKLFYEGTCFTVQGNGDTVSQALDQAKKLLNEEIKKIKRETIKLQ